MSKRIFCFSVALLCSAMVSAQSESGNPLNQDEATDFIKGKTLNSTRVAGGRPRIQFSDDGKMYGSSDGSSDSGKWEIKDGKLCMAWRRWEYEGCGALVKGADLKVRHLYPGGSSVHLIFN